MRHLQRLVLLVLLLLKFMMKACVVEAVYLIQRLCLLICRAGRDGREASCILLYTYADAQRMRHMLTESAKENGTNPHQLQANIDSLNGMVGC